MSEQQFKEAMRSATANLTQYVQDNVRSGARKKQVLLCLARAEAIAIDDVEKRGIKLFTGKGPGEPVASGPVGPDPDEDGAQVTLYDLPDVEEEKEEA